MPNRFLQLMIVALVGLAACATEQGGNQAARLPHGFQEVSINQLMSNQLRHALPISIKIPAIYKSHKPLLAIPTVWSVDEDWKQLAKNKDATSNQGFIVATISQEFGYDQARDLFFGSPTGDEKTMVSDMIKQGWMDVHVTRAIANSYPVLLVEAWRSDGMRLRMMYIGIRVSTNAIFIHYHSRQPWSAVDELVWATLKNSVLASKK